MNIVIYNNLNDTIVMQHCISNGDVIADFTKNIYPKSYNYQHLYTSKKNKELKQRCNITVVVDNIYYELNLQMSKDVFSNENYGITHISPLNTTITILRGSIVIYNITR